jgi:hypothetical protein
MYYSVDSASAAGAASVSFGGEAFGGEDFGGEDFGCELFGDVGIFGDAAGEDEPVLLNALICLARKLVA